MKVCIDPGHGGKDSGAVGNGYLEKDLTLAVAKNLKEFLSSYGVDAVMTRETDVTLDPNPRTQAVKSTNADICISVHFNAANGKGRGAETVYQVGNTESQKLAKLVLDEVSNLGIVERRAFSKVSQNNPGQDYYFMLRLTKPITSIILECLFIDNPDDAAFLKEINVIGALAEAIGTGVLRYFNIEKPVQKTPIMGSSIANIAQMEGYLHSINPNAPYYARIYIEEGDVEGVRGDLAFAQSLHETGYFRFGGQVSATQNNFAGIGSTRSGVSGASFTTPREGIRAQIQHLKAYSRTEPLVNPKVDPRFDLVVRGSAPNMEDLDGKWAVPGIGYGRSIVEIMNKILEVQAKPEEDWAKPYMDNLSKLGIIGDPHNSKDVVKWGELAEVISKTIEMLKK